MSIYLALSLILIICFLFGQTAKKLHLSEVIGLLVAGLVLSLPPYRELLAQGNLEVIAVLSDIGLIALMFLAGFEVSWSMIVKEERDSLIITVSTLITSLVLGFVVFYLLGFSLEASFIMGVCFGITAEATKARVLIQLKKLNTKIGALLMGSGILNDLVGVLFLGLIAYLFTESFSWNEAKMLGSVILAFFLGAIAHYRLNRESKGVKILEQSVLVLLVPFFFVNMGLNFKIDLSVFDLKLVMIVVIVAAIGQLLGAIITKPLTHLSMKQLYLVGWGMNSKGAVELAIAYIALNIGILPANLYSSLVITALISTVLFQLIIFRTVGNDPGVMD